MGYTNAQLRAMGLGHLIDETTDDDGNKRKRSKYGNIKAEDDGLKFDSQKEHRRYKQLRTMERTGIIRDLQHHVKYEIAAAVKFPSKKTKSQPRYYEADFVYVDTRTGKTIVEDVKCESTAKNQLYLFKKHLMMLLHGIEIQEV